MHCLQACSFKYITVAAFCIYLSVVKMPLKGEVVGQALKSHGNYIVDHGRSWKNHGIVLLNFCGNPDGSMRMKHQNTDKQRHTDESKNTLKIKQPAQMISKLKMLQITLKKYQDNTPSSPNY